MEGYYEKTCDNVSENYGYDASGLKVELDVSSNDSEMYLVSGQLKGECDEDLEDSYGDYEKGYFISIVLVYDGDVVLCNSDIYEKDEKDDMQDEIDDVVDEYESDKEAFKEDIEETCEMAASLKGLEDGYYDEYSY